MGKSKFLAIFVLLYIFIMTCQGAIWKTEDAYIVDDLPEDNDEPSETEASNTCMDSTGAQGKCVPIQECNVYYNILSSDNKISKFEILEGVRKYLNETNKAEPCSGPEESNSTAANYVCCTSLKYANMKSISLADYFAREPASNETIPALDVASAKAAIIQKVVGGAPANPGEFPYTVAILENGRQFCGGSLIDSQWVLTAAHCFDKFSSSPHRVRQLLIKVADHNLRSPTDVPHQEAYVSKLFLHPAFFRNNGFFKSDVALVKLKAPIQRADNVRTVLLHSGTPNIDRSLVEAVVSGWGQVCSSCPLSDELRKAKLRVITNSDCSQRYAGSPAPPITETMVCATGSGGADACNGDSGGPLVIYYGGKTYQIGIVSWGIGQYPGVYTRVSSVLGWITKHKNKGVV